MKSLINLRTGAMMLMLILLSGTSARADVENFVLSVREVTHPTANTIEFNLYILDDDGAQDFEFAALQMGLLLNSSIYGSGTLTVSYSNTNSELDGDQQFVYNPDVVTNLTGYAGKTLIRLMANNIPPVPPGAGSGTVISATGDGTLLARFTITSSETFAPNSLAGLEFCSGDAPSPLYPTVVYSYIDGNSTALGVTAGIDAIVDGDPLLNPTLPAEFNVTGGGSYCEGGDGMPIGLDGSELNTNYDLWLDEIVVATEPGTGAAISFGNQTEGTYTVTGTNVAGDTPMTGQAVVSETSNNTITLTSGAGTDSQSVCFNSAITTITYSTTGATGATFSGLPDGVDGSWAAGVVTISGTPTAAGTSDYTVSLTGGCGTVSATGSITVNAIPTITNTTPGERCGPGQVTLGATASAGTINWYSVATGGTSLGTGPSFTTPVISATTTYYVDATANGCTTATRTEVTATVNAIPAITNTTSAERCGPGQVTLGAAASSGTINWYDVATGGTSLGTGTSFTTPVISATTTYYVDATANGCTTATRTEVTATVNAIPAITNTTSAERCGPGQVTLGAAASSGTINWYDVATGGTSLGTGTSFTTPVISTTTTYYVDATANGCTTESRTPVQATVNALPAAPVHTVDCSSGFDHAIITVTSPLGTGYQYSLNGGAYQTGTVFSEISNGSYTITVRTPEGCTTTGASFEVSCGCVNGPTLALSSTSGSTCGTTPVIVSDNTFSGSATEVTISENGAGSVSPPSANASPFSFTYTPAAGDIGNTVTITVTTNNPLGSPCEAATATYLLTVNVIPAITSTTPGERCGPGVVTLGATASAGTINWYSVATGGTSLGTGTSFTTPVITTTTTYYVDATANGCTTESRTLVQATINPFPGAAGPITGPSSFTPGSSGISYSVAPITAATAYIWSYSGTGVTINGSGESITLDFDTEATVGTLSVYGSNSCGDGESSSLDLTPATKTLTLTSVLLEGLYSGGGTMREVSNGYASQFPGSADQIRVELHEAANYSNIVYFINDVELSLNGTATITVPAEYSGSYYVTIKHRNSIETTTAIPVSFAGSSINQSFAVRANVYGANLKASFDGYYLIYGADVNQDGIVDTGDMNDVDNGSAIILIGYNLPDANGDGLVDTSDMNMVDNNSAAIVYLRIPF